MRDSKAMEKVRETGDSGMIISEILCLFLLLKLLDCLPPFPSPYCMVESHVNIESSKSATPRMGFSINIKGKDLGIPNSLMFQVGTY